MHTGDTSNSSTGSWQYGLTVDVDDLEALYAYQTHPAHQAIVAEVEGSYEDWVVVDYVLDPVGAGPTG